jgi:hypothetical protein
MSSDITEEEGGSTQERDTGERFAQRPGRKDDSEKLAYNLLPMDALDEVVKRFTHGAKNTRRITGKRWMTPWNGTALP